MGSGGFRRRHTRQDSKPPAERRSYAHARFTPCHAGFAGRSYASYRGKYAPLQAAKSCAVLVCAHGRLLCLAAGVRPVEEIVPVCERGRPLCVRPAYADVFNQIRSEDFYCLVAGSYEKVLIQVDRFCRWFYTDHAHVVVSDGSEFY